MPNTITNRQMFLILFMTISISSVEIPKVAAQSVGRSGWVTILLTALLFSAVAYLWARLNSLHQEKMLYDYSKELVGSVGAYFLGVYFAQYFITMFVAMGLSMSNLLQVNFLPKTPPWVTSLALLPVIGFIANKGVTNTARLVEIYSAILIVTALTVNIIMLMQGDTYYILPLFNAAETGTILSSVKEFIFSFLGVEVLAMIPFTKKTSPKAGFTAVAAILLVGMWYVLNTEACIMMIGVDEVVHYNFPWIMAFRQVEIPLLKVFQRIDLMFVPVGFIGVFAGMSVIYLGIVEFMCRMLPKVKRYWVVMAVGAVIFLIEVILTGINNIQSIMKNYLTYSGVFIAAIVPLVLLILTKVKNHGRKKSA